MGKQLITHFERFFNRKGYGIYVSSNEVIRTGAIVRHMAFVWKFNSLLTLSFSNDEGWYGKNRKVHRFKRKGTRFYMGRLAIDFVCFKKKEE